MQQKDKRNKTINALTQARALDLWKEIKVLQETRQIIDKQIEEKEKQAQELQN